MDTIHEDDEMADRLGREIVAVLGLHRDREHRDRYQTAWGAKTAVGIARTVVRIISEGNTSK